jgi:hypothetical protein
MELSELGLSKNNYPIIINYRTPMFEIAAPVFAGILCSLMLCAVIGVVWGIYKETAEIEAVVEIVSVEEMIDEEEKMPTEIDEITDTVLKYFRDPEYKDWVIEFFTDICLDREIAQAILENSLDFKIPPSLAFALSWEESRFDPRAINGNNRNGSIDRGLFQLNNLSFPNLETITFFDINSNAYYGLAHLRFCLDTGKNEISALAMYNAGTTRVRNTGAPIVTLNYISRILEYRAKIESQFLEKLIKEEDRPEENTDYGTAFTSVLQL